MNHYLALRHGISQVSQQLMDLSSELERVLARDEYPPYGRHFRHCLDHVNCLLAGLGEGVIDYDARGRNSEVERDPGKFRAELRRALDRLSALEPATLAATVVVRHTVDGAHLPAETPSTIGREWAFLTSHAIHHLAIVRMLAERRGLAVGQEVGVAFSTLAAEKQGLAAASGSAD